jgi:hypothetical protein
MAVAGEGLRAADRARRNSSRRGDGGCGRGTAEIVSYTYSTVYKKIVSYLEKGAPFLPPIASDFAKYFAFGNAP